MAAAALLVTVADLPVVHGQLSSPPDAAQRLAWLAHAVAMAPGRPDLLLLEISQCRLWRQPCDHTALEARLRSLDPDNGAGWLDALANAAKNDDNAGIDAALAAVGNTRRIDTYYTSLTVRLTDALHRIGGEPVMDALTWVDGMLSGELFDGFTAFATVCNSQASLTARRVNLCRTASLAFERGDTLLANSIGSVVASRLWAVGTREHRAAAARSRQLDYMESQSQRLLAPPGPRLRTLLDLMDGRYFVRTVQWDAEYSSEQEVLRAQLVHAGLRPDPPPSWKDPDP